MDEYGLHHLRRIAELQNLEAEYGPERILRDKRNPFEFYDNDTFRNRYRFSKESVHYIIGLVEEQLKHTDERGSGIPTYLQVLLVFRFYATGNWQVDIGDFIHIHQTTVSRIIKKTSQVFARLRPRYIKFPTQPAELRIEHEAFHRTTGIPGIVGAIDGTHIPISNPGGENAIQYVNRKNFFSINCQVTCNSKMEITSVVARWYGSAHDARIFNESHLMHQFENNTYRGILLGDAGYPCLRYLLTPVNNPATAPQRAYNYAHSKGRTIIERVFGVMKRRFACLTKGLRLQLNTSKTVTVAVAVLYNISRMLNEPDIDEEDNIFDDVPVQIYEDQDDIGGAALKRRIIEEYFS